MSGIYIPGMEMPTSCYLCPVNKDDGFGYFTCGVTHSECDFLKLPPDCPLIPVPDHGRLIDADAFERHECNGCDGACEALPCDCINCDAECRCDFMLDIHAAPTIIPADKEGEG